MPAVRVRGGKRSRSSRALAGRRFSCSHVLAWRGRRRSHIPPTRLSPRPCARVLSASPRGLWGRTAVVSPVGCAAGDMRDRSCGTEPQPGNLPGGCWAGLGRTGLDWGVCVPSAVSRRVRMCPPLSAASPAGSTGGQLRCRPSALKFNGFTCRDRVTPHLLPQAVKNTKM